ncbi:MAG: transcription-repair coupling factor, partial [Candidatus Puniceispirillum sp.]
MNFINKIELDDSIWGCPDGAHMLAVAALAEAKGRILYVARDDARLALMRDALMRLAPSIDILVFPAWDCLPYDRLSPQGALVGQRIEALAKLASDQALLSANTIVLTTVNAFLQRVPPKSYFEESSLHIAVGQTIEPSALAAFLVDNAYLRTDTVRETGEFAVRGGILDVFPPGHANPIRLDFFGDEIETMRSFDPSNQRSIGKADRLTLHPVAEFRLNSQTVERFRTGYLAKFGA